MSYLPPQRPIPSLCFAVSRWIRGTFHLPKLHGFEDNLSRLRTFVPLTQVDLGSGPLPFVALRASALQAVAPLVPEDDLLLEASPGAKARAVSCYLENLAVHGTLELHPGVRTSDFLVLQDGFIPIRRCRVVPGGAGLPEPVPVVFVNASAVIAVTEEAPEAVAAERAESRAAASPAPRLVTANRAGTSPRSAAATRGRAPLLRRRP